MSVELLIANFLRIASEDLEGARVLAKVDNRNAIYLCEQAAEKIIRAVVTSEGKHAGIKHVLAEIVDLVPDENPLERGLRSLEHLSRYATAFRYPVSSSARRESRPRRRRPSCRRSSTRSPPPSAKPSRASAWIWNEPTRQPPR